MIRLRMFGNRVPHMLDNDYTPYSAVDIFVKDLVRIFVKFLHSFFLSRLCACHFLLIRQFFSQGIVNNEGSVLSLPLNLSAVAHQQFLAGPLKLWF